MVDVSTNVMNEPGPVQDGGPTRRGVLYVATPGIHVGWSTTLTWRAMCLPVCCSAQKRVHIRVSVFLF